MISKINKLNTVWNELFNHFDIINRVREDGIFEISAEQIKTIGKYEPRLAAKFDKSSELPIVFQKNNLSILPIGWGKYIIGYFDTFAKIDFNNFDEPIKKSFPDILQSIDLNNITSEAIALNVAHASGMIDEILDEEFTYLTLSGRMSSGNLNFKIKNKLTKELDSIDVESAQIEIDGIYEGLDSIAVIEAKNNVPADFMVRQLYYPYLRARAALTNKKIRPIFLTYSKSVFSFYEFEFKDPNVYSSIKSVRQNNFILDALNDIEFSEIMDIYNNTKAGPEPIGVPFPQADYFGRVMDLMDYLNRRNGRSKKDIADKYSFDGRQADYYSNSLVYLGFADKPERGGNRKLSRYGKMIANGSSLKQEKLAFAKAILERGAFREYFEKVLDNGGEHLSNREAAEIVEKYTGSSYNEGTRNRRRLSLKSWIHWLFNLAK